MKPIVWLLLFAVIYFGRCKSPSKISKIGLRSATTLDSLQGNWTNEDDALWQMNIKGRIINEIYKDADLKNTIYKIYFSDTLVNAADFNSIRIDTSLARGNYLIARELDDDSILCYEINGFSKPGKHVLLSLSSTWANYKVNIFVKK
jgi:hypothetical protein